MCVCEFLDIYQFEDNNVRDLPIEMITEFTSQIRLYALILGI